MDKVIILTEEDTYMTLSEWQSVYGLKADHIGQHFKLSEPKFQEDLKRYGRLIVCAPLIKVMDLARVYWKKPFVINSFNRDEIKQQELRDSGARAAATSPHVYKLAADINTKNEEDTLSLVKCIKRASLELNIPVRIGYRDYIFNKQYFVHVDVCPLYYSSKKTRYLDDHPVFWEKEIEW
jgi:hypothetical protein